MSKSNRYAASQKLHSTALHSHWNSGHLTPSLGCQHCVYLDTCGTLQVRPGVFDCMTYCCCVDASSCDNVCPRNPAHLVAREREVGGFQLNDVQAAPPVKVPPLPLVVPLIYHGSSRVRPLSVGVAALSLFSMFNKRDGTLRFATRRHLLDHFKLANDTKIILSGTHEDSLLEAWWRLRDREAIIRGLRKLGIVLVTTPNYSLFSDVPRPDNLFNMKRIAMVWSEFQREGIPCALHLNARTDRDFERWTDFLREHPEITHVAFEFGTGAGAGRRISWHVDHLVSVTRAVRRPLHLIVRGGVAELRLLSNTFAGVTYIDTSAFVKALRRQRLVPRLDQLSAECAPTPRGSPIDALLAENIATVRGFVECRATQ